MPISAATSGSEVRLTASLGRTYWVYAGCFIAFILIMALLSRIGVPDRVIGYAFIALTLITYVVIGVISRTMQASEYFVAGRRVPALYNGMAAGSMPGMSLMGVAGSLYLLGYDGLGFVLGGTGGYVLIAVLIAPYLRKSGAYTVPDFLAVRYGGSAARLLSVIVLLCCSFAYLVAVTYGVGIIAARFLGIDFDVAVYVGLAVIIACSMLGGMRSVTWTQVAQFIVLLVAFLVPAIWISAIKTGVPIPQLMYGEALQNISTLGAAQGIAPAYVAPFSHDGYGPLNFILLVLCLMIGTASLPHILMRSFTTPTVRQARTSVAWSLLFVGILFITAPAYAAFAKWTMLDLVASGLTPQNIAEKAAWLFRWAAADNMLVQICGKAAVDAGAVLAACNEAGVTNIGFADINLHPDMIVLATPEMAGAPYVITGLAAAGGVAAAFATANGIALAIANTLSHDIYHKVIHRSAPRARRLVVSRILLVLVAASAAYVATTKPSDLLTMASWALSLAAAGFFPALVLGIWWKRATSIGAISGMIAGFSLCLYYMLGTRYGAVSFVEMWSWFSAATAAQLEMFEQLKAAYGMAAAGEAQAAAWAALDTHAQMIASWFGVRNVSAAAFGLPVGFLVTWLVSLMTKEHSAFADNFVDDIRVPRGTPPLEQA